jgi:signal peptidase I
MTISELTDDRVHTLQCEMAAELLRSFGRLRLKVTGWSMLPAIWPGDTLELERLNQDELRTGETVLFSRDGRLVVHRILRASGSTIVTCGDTMPQADAAITQKALLGRVTRIYRDGGWIQASATRSLAQRAVARLARSSNFAARVIVGIHGLRETKASQF